jgi:hypothetical protein
MQGNLNRVLERIFLAYRRMFEYGTRLTMRQFTEHLSYIITSGLRPEDISLMHQKNSSPFVTEHLFVNRFFGDNGYCRDESAQQMKAIRAINMQGFGARPSSRWEHRLWLGGGAEPEVELNIEKLKNPFNQLRRHGSQEPIFKHLPHSDAREQVRRIIYFLYDFGFDEYGYLPQYLNSPTLVEWHKWQQSDANLGLNDKTNLERKIYHVLQEHFTGVRLPEGATRGDRRLYVTLSRRRSEVRQSSQIVLAEVDWSSSVSLELVELINATGQKRRDLILVGKGLLSGISLPLRVPFLDYVMMRHIGEQGEILEASYLERLDRFKALVHKKASAAEDNRIMLVRLKTDHTFRRQRFSVNDDHLEVTDVL